MAKIEKLQKFNEKNVLKYNPVTLQGFNDGRYKEIIYKANVNNYVDYTLDNKINTKFGDQQNGNYIYQVKSRHCEIKLVKSLNLNCNTFKTILNNYLKYEKANRYVYVIRYDNEMYAITMNTREFKDFVEKFGRYSKHSNSIRIHRADSTIWKWVQGC